MILVLRLETLRLFLLRSGLMDHHLLIMSIRVFDHTWKWKSPRWHVSQTATYVPHYFLLHSICMEGYCLSREDYIRIYYAIQSIQNLMQGAMTMF